MYAGRRGHTGYGALAWAWPAQAAAQPTAAQPAPVPATAAPALSGTTPTRPSLRKLLGAVLRSDTDLEAFSLDYFPATHARFTAGMDTKQKTNLLLQHEAPAVILAKLREHDAAAVSQNEGSLRFE
jgi:hypothetical protein